MRDTVDMGSGPRKVPSPDQKVDVDKEMGEIHREVIESRNLVIKTDNLLKNLHAEVKLVGRKQDEFQKRQWLSSATAYLIFAVLAIGAGLIAFSIRNATASHERERLEKNIAELRGQLERQRNETHAAQLSARAASEVYRQMTAGSGDERLRGIDALAKLDTSKLSALEKQALVDRAELLRKEIGQVAFDRGRTAFRRNEMKSAIVEFSRFMAMNPPAQELTEASFFLGVAYALSRRHEEAVPMLARFVAEDKKAKSRPYAMLLLSHSYEQAGQPDKAAEIAREALGTYPNSEFAGQLRTRLSSAVRQMSSASTEDGRPAKPSKPVRAGAPQ
jgi:TolA-binding protein